MTEMVLPQFGMGMADGTITAWHKAVGDAVKQGEHLCDVEAAKTTVEVNAPCDGILQGILVPSGTNVPVNTVIAIIGDAPPLLVSADATDLASRSPPEPAPAIAASPVPLPVTPSQRCDLPGQGPQVEPRARRAARKHGLDLAMIRGTGPGGRIIEEDVVRAAQSGNAPAQSASPPFVPSDRANAVLYQVRMRCDATPLASLLDGIAEAGLKRVSVVAILVKASALALAEAGCDRKSVGVRSDEGELGTIEGAFALSVGEIEGMLGAKVQTPADHVEAQAPMLVLEPLPEEGLEDVIRISLAGPASLSVSAFPLIADDSRGDWQFTLSHSHASMSPSTARQFLKALRKLLERPLAILI